MHSLWECCETVNCLHNLHSLTPLLLLLFSRSALFLNFFFGHASLFPICHSLHHRAFTPVVGRHAEFSALYFPFNGLSGRRTPALTCSDSSDLHPSRQRELISAEVRKIFPSSTFWKVRPKTHRFWKSAISNGASRLASRLARCSTHRDVVLFQTCERSSKSSVLAGG